MLVFIHTLAIGHWSVAVRSHLHAYILFAVETNEVN